MWDKKGQIADTMTWVVATLVIVVVLGILVFVTYSVSDKKLIFLDDKEKDFIATKSITSFLRNGENVDLLENENNEEEIKKLLNLMSIGDSSSGYYVLGEDDIKPGEEFNELGLIIGSEFSGWNLEIELNSVKKSIKTFTDISDIGFSEYFDTNFILDDIKLRFWKECLENCK